MKLEQHVLSAIDDFEQGKVEGALLHACLAIDATARKIFPTGAGGKLDYKNCIRQYYWLLEAFCSAGINLEETKWTNVKLDNGHGKLIVDPDLADLIYHKFRCSQAHAEEIPVGFELIPVINNTSKWIIGIQDGSVRMPAGVIWGLLAIAVFSKVNSGIPTQGEYFLTYSSGASGVDEKFLIRDWWGREDEVKVILARYPRPRVKLQGL